MNRLSFVSDRKQKRGRSSDDIVVASFRSIVGEVGTGWYSAQREILSRYMAAGSE
jgi:hypothetical protein